LFFEQPKARLLCFIIEDSSDKSALLSVGVTFTGALSLLLTECIWYYDNFYG